MDYDSLELMKGFIAKHLNGMNGTVLDIGSAKAGKRQPKETYRDLFEPRFKYTGMDITDGENVDIIGYSNIKKTYDIVVSGQVMEHVKDPWDWLKNLAKYSNKYVCIIAPWKFKEHKHPIDTFRYLPDGMRALFEYAQIKEVEIFRKGCLIVGIGTVNPVEKQVFKDIKISIVIPVLNSHRAVARQLKYFKKLKLPDTVEIILMDDGSYPPLEFVTADTNCTIYPTGDFRPWTQPCARNLGVRIARGEYIFMTDIDHIITSEAIKAVEDFDGDKMVFPRSFAVLDNKGNLSIEPRMLFKYGLTRSRYRKRDRRVYTHTNTYAIKKKIFEEIDGYPLRICGRNTYPTRDDRFFYHRYRRHCEAGFCKKAVTGPEIHVFPASASDPMHLFHNLSRGVYDDRV